jgi:hypothetical protein
MLTQIEDAMVDRIKTKMSGLAGMVNVQKGEGLSQPAVYVSTDEGKFEKITIRSYRQEVKTFVDIVFSHLASEGERRKGVNCILQGIIQVLMLETLGLNITPLIPRGWRNVTSEEWRSKGLIVFSLQLTTSFVVNKLYEEEADDLLLVGLNYYLTPGDDVADVTDTITLTVSGDQGEI